MKKILIIEDDDHIIELLKFNVENNGYEVDVAMDGREGLNKAINDLPDLILLDLMLPSIDGIDICKKLKSKDRTKDIPIIMLTAKGHETDKILGLEIGADDYITKPFSVRELMTRVKVIFRRYSKEVHKTEAVKVVIGDLEIDHEKHEVRRGGELVKLTLKEYQLLEYLAENRGKVLSRNALLDRVWGYDYFGETRTVDVHIRHLRKKIEDDNAELIETIRGVGYKIK
ncbi:response regulator transcription factor [Acidaminobacter sp. JC074]|uniref:winged helix-turn-helix domain-containing protein n=1 Tax=Acidaminobacter sp. JC074 TaxID=2530199 RepID=UPI001F0F5546|nr:response regulator transcription factor [Acidaminobacter sp. JC074]MCH4889502.1 response regulator transcription factor [Acidaminobacter sp. JC074]